MMHECEIIKRFDGVSIHDEYNHELFSGGWALERQHETVTEVIIEYIPIIFCPFCGEALAKEALVL